MLDKLKLSVEDIIFEQERRKYRRIDYLFPDAGEFPRDGYKKHLDFFEATKSYREIAFIAGNRTGKSEAGAYAVALWLTGEYPHWWNGRVFAKPTNILVAGETSKLVRDSMQFKLAGPPGRIGEGMIPREHIVRCTSKSGVPDALDTIVVNHKSGGESIVQFQSYDQGREAFQATARDVVWQDEEPPLSVHNECLIRTMTTRGLVMLTFTPLKGRSDTVNSIFEKAEKGSAKIVTATWDDAPHLSEQDKSELMAALPPYQRDARSKGIPQLGSGAVYPVPETDFLVDPFMIPKHYRRAYGMDVGWNYTAACWGAYDPEHDVLYITHDYKRSQAEPSSHADAIRVKGVKKGVIDPASQGRSQDDGKKLVDLYRMLGLDLTLADNAVEAGIFEFYQRLTTGRLKVFKTCQAFLEEYRLYRRDEKGRIVKENDHVLDAARYLCRSGLQVAEAGEVKPDMSMIDPYAARVYRGGGSSWMAD